MHHRYNLCFQLGRLCGLKSEIVIQEMHSAACQHQLASQRARAIFGFGCRCVTSFGFGTRKRLVLWPFWGPSELSASPNCTLQSRLKAKQTVIHCLVSWRVLFCHGCAVNPAHVGFTERTFMIDLDERIPTPVEFSDRDSPRSLVATGQKTLFQEHMKPDYGDLLA